jgi:hypothetical protein
MYACFLGGGKWGNFSAEHVRVVGAVVGNVVFMGEPRECGGKWEEEKEKEEHGYHGGVLVLGKWVGSKWVSDKWVWVSEWVNEWVINEWVSDSEKAKSSLNLIYCVVCRHTIILTRRAGRNFQDPGLPASCLLLLGVASSLQAYCWN